MKVFRSLLIVGAVAALLLPAAASAQVYVENNNLGVNVPNPLFTLHIRKDGLPAFQFEQVGTPDIKFNFRINALGEFIIAKVGDSPVGASMRVISRGAPNTVVIGGPIGATAFNNTSSRSLKENFTHLDGSEVLAKVVDLPITRWNFKADPRSTPHLGPMAEDFHAAFGVGVDDTHIALNDLGGVALAAIQGLHAEVEEKDQLIDELLRRVEELERRLGSR